MARVAQQQGDRAGAARQAGQAVTICGRANDPICVAEAQQIK
jgi:hypothetical protein